MNEIRNSVNQKIKGYGIAVLNVPAHSVKIFVDSDITPYGFKCFFAEAMSSNPKIRAQVRSDGKWLNAYLFNDSNESWSGTVFIFGVK